MTRAEVECGSCGFRVVVVARGDHEGVIALEVESECEDVQRLIEEVGRVDPYAEGGSFFTSTVYQAADRCLRHVDCIVPSAVMRAVNVEAGLALPHQARMDVVRG